MSNNIFTRSYYPEELKILDTRLSKEKEALRKIIKYENFLIALLIGISSAFFTTIIKHDSFLFACLIIVAGIAFAYIFFMSFFIYYDTKYHKRIINTLCANINYGKVVVNRIHSKRIAIAKGIPDDFTEGTSDYFIMELEADSVLYFFANNYEQSYGLPCLDFDIYETEVAFYMGRTIYSLSEPVDPILIEANTRLNYEKKFGAPKNNILNINFDKLIEQYNNCA